MGTSSSMSSFGLILISVLVARLPLLTAKGGAIQIEKGGRNIKSPKFINENSNFADEGESDSDQTHSHWTNGDIRLASDDDLDPSSGRLEVYMNTLLDGSGEDTMGTWGTVCGVGFSFREAHVACRQLGFSSAIKFEPSYQQGNASTPIFLEGVKCSRRNLGHLMRCRATSPTFINCTHDHDVSVFCDSTPIWSKPYRGQVRLINENTTIPLSYGRVEVYQAQVWGTVCNQEFHQAAADTVCRQLGYTNAIAISDAIPGEGLIWVDAITCNSSSPCFKSCFKAHKWSHVCSHTEDVAVHCTYDLSLAMENTAGSAAKCKIRVFPASLLVLVIVMVLGSLVAIGCGGVIVFTAVRCCYRKKYSPRNYDQLQ